MDPTILSSRELGHHSIYVQYVFCIHLMENIPYNIQQQQDSEVANRNTVLHMMQYYTQ